MRMDPQSASPVCHFPAELWSTILYTDNVKVSTQNMLRLKRTCKWWNGALDTASKRYIAKVWLTNTCPGFDGSVSTHFIEKELRGGNRHILYPLLAAEMQHEPAGAPIFSHVLYTIIDKVKIGKPYTNSKTIFTLLIKAGCDIHLYSITPIGESILDCAVKNAKSIWYVRTLLNAKASLTSVDDCGYTPLHNAVFSRSISMIQLLLDHGAPVDVRNNDGKYPEDLAHDCVIEESRNPRVKKWLTQTNNILLLLQKARHRLPLHKNITMLYKQHKRMHKNHRRPE